VPSAAESFINSECVSCGACVEACPTAALSEKSIAALARPAEKSVTTTCAYCGVGCSLKAEVVDGQVSRMVPNRAGHANQGHACVKGRFAYGYATHPDRIKSPMIRAKITDPWREVRWDEAINHAASEFQRIQAQYGRGAVGGITSSRCTNEEVYLVQKLIRAAFGNNNVDTCARVCHSPTGFGLKQTLGESAGTQTFMSVMKSDVVIVMGANPTDGHPVFASHLKRALRAGAKLIVIDPREIALTRTPHIESAYHLQLRPGTNVATITALAHVVVTEGLVKEDYVTERCEKEAFEKWRSWVADPRHSPEATEAVTGVPAAIVRGWPLGCTHPLRTVRSITGSASLSTARAARPSSGIANLAMATGNIGREGVGVEPAARSEQRAGFVRHGLFPARISGLSPRLG
jgi:formate dehydrogenase major subunit